MEQSFEPFKEQIRQQATHRADIIDQGILLWNCLYTRVLQYKETYADQWLFISHEELSLAPKEGFNRIFEYLELQMEPQVLAYIEQSTAAKKTSDLVRDSKKNIHTWKERLTAAEIARVKAGTQGVWTSFYTDSDW